MRQVKFNSERMKSACESGFMNAMATATYLAKRGVPFRKAHEVVANAVQKCVSQECELEQLSLDELREFSPVFDTDVYEQLTVKNVLACHDVPGGTAPHQVAQALKAAREKIATMREAHGTHA
jgi:argininosuccinate lyase